MAIYQSKLRDLQNKIKQNIGININTADISLPKLTLEQQALIVQGAGNCLSSVYDWYIDNGFEYVDGTDITALIEAYQNKWVSKISDAIDSDLQALIFAYKIGSRFNANNIKESDLTTINVIGQNPTTDGIYKGSRGGNKVIQPAIIAPQNAFDFNQYLKNGIMGVGRVLAVREDGINNRIY